MAADNLAKAANEVVDSAQALASMKQSVADMQPMEQILKAKPLEITADTADKFLRACSNCTSLSYLQTSLGGDAEVIAFQKTMTDLKLLLFEQTVELFEHWEMFLENLWDRSLMKATDAKIVKPLVLMFKMLGILSVSMVMDTLFAMIDPVALARLEGGKSYTDVKVITEITVVPKYRFLQEQLSSLNGNDMAIICADQGQQHILDFSWNIRLYMVRFYTPDFIGVRSIHLFKICLRIVRLGFAYVA